jgi:pilus assembly protein CpaB
VLGAGFEHKAVETVLRNVRVIAVDQRMESKPGEAVVGHTATFEVTPKQSEVIALASKIGEMFLTLRSLAPSPQERMAADKLASDGAGQDMPDSPVAATATCTLDSDVGLMLPKVLSTQGACDASVITILRGSTKGGDSSAPPAAGKGS